MSDLGLVLYDADTGEEIEGVNFPSLQTKISIGDEIHYWQDGTEDRGGGEAVVRPRDFLVSRVRHDLRYMPSRGASPLYVHTLEVWVTEIKAE